MRLILILLVSITTHLFATSQNKTIAIKINPELYATSILNVNGVTIRSVKIISDSIFLKKLLYENSIEAKYFNSWFHDLCGKMYMLKFEDGYNALKTDTKGRVPRDNNSIIILISSAQDFLKIYYSFSNGRIPPPIVPPNTLLENRKYFKYEHIEFCKPENDGCVMLCVKKAEASFEVCCKGVCYQIIYDGELKMTASVEKDIK